MPVLLLQFVQRGSLNFDPGVCLEASVLLSAADPQHRCDPAPLKQPAQHEGLLQAVRSQKQMPGSRLLKPRNRAGAAGHNRITHTRAFDRAVHEPIEHAPPPAVSRQAQANPRCRQRHGCFDNQAARVCAQVPEPAPRFYSCFQPCTSKKVAPLQRDSPLGWEERVPKGWKGPPGCTAGESSRPRPRAPQSIPRPTSCRAIRANRARNAPLPHRIRRSARPAVPQCF